MVAILCPVALVCFCGTVATDLAYQSSDGNLLWLNFSAWLLAAGLLFGLFALIAMLIDALRGAGWAAVAVFFGTCVVELINSFFHARDGWTAVVPSGLLMSILGALLALVSGWLLRSVPHDAGATHS